MMRIWWFIACVFGISSCVSSYELISPDTINKDIQYDVSIVGPAELLQKIYPYQDSTSVVIDWKKTRRPYSYKIFLTHISPESNTKVLFRVHATHIHSIWHVEKILTKTKKYK